MKKLLVVRSIFSFFACSKNTSVKMKGSETEVNLVEGTTDEIFNHLKNEMTANYISGYFG